MAVNLSPIASVVPCEGLPDVLAGKGLQSSGGAHDLAELKERLLPALDSFSLLLLERFAAPLVILLRLLVFVGLVVIVARVRLNVLEEGSRYLVPINLR